MPTIDIDGRGATVQDAAQDLWKRLKPLQAKGYHPVTSVEIVDVKSGKIMETYQLTDPEFVDLVLEEDERAPVSVMTKTPGHKPPAPHESPFIARLRVES